MFYLALEQMVRLPCIYRNQTQWQPLMMPKHLNNRFPSVAEVLHVYHHPLQVTSLQVPGNVAQKNHHGHEGEKRGGRNCHGS